MCARHGLHDFHERHIQVGRWHVAGLGYSNPTPFNTPGEYSEPQIGRAPAALRRTRPRWCWSATRRLTARRSTRSAPACTPGRAAVRDFIEKHQPEYFFCGHIHEAEGVAARDREDPRLECRQDRAIC